MFFMQKQEEGENNCLFFEFCLTKILAFKEKKNKHKNVVIIKENRVLIYKTLVA